MWFHTGIVKTIAVGSCLIVHSWCQAQLYNFSLRKQKIEILSSAIFWTGIQTYDLVRKSEVLDEFEDIDPSRLWQIDRHAIHLNSSSADHLSDITLFGSLAIPVVLTVVEPELKSEAWNIALMGIHGYLIENGFNQLVKIMGERPRPYIYRQGENVLNTRISKNSTKSFYSGHASSSAYFSFFGAKVFSDLCPDSKLKPLIWGVAATVSGVTGHLRYRAGKHFYSDIIAGWLIGGAIGILIPEINKSPNLDISFEGQRAVLKITI